MQDRFSDTKERFHVVQLALFNAQLLSATQIEAETNPQGICAKLIDQCAKETVAAYPPAPSTINQSLFFGMAYLSIVWLSESLTREQVEKASTGEKVGTILSRAKLTGPRSLEKGADFFRLIRNALSHGNVSIDDEFCFKFWDQDTKKTKGGGPREEEETSLSLENHLLGELMMEYYKEVSSIIYNDRLPSSRP